MMYEEMLKQQLKILENDNRLLAQEIEDLKEQVNYQDIWRKEYIKRIDKAIEYIKENFCNNNNLNSCWHEDVRDLLNILEGDE